MFTNIYEERIASIFNVEIYSSRESPEICRWTTPHQDIVIITTLAYRV
jgi:hypothetical protein